MSGPRVHDGADTSAEHAHGHPSDHGHDHGHDHSHTHPHDHEAGHSHPHGGVKGLLYHVFVPHSHDPADAIDDAMEASAAGVRALKISLVIMLATALAQVALVVVTNSVALLADTIHNFADALTAVPLWIAFVLGRRAASRRYTYGYGRAEDLAGMFIVFVIALSAAIAGWEAIDRFIHPATVADPWVLLAAGFVGFVGNEAVAIYRIRTGQKIGSAALVADGIHARIDGLTSLAVVLGAIGVLVGLPLADPIIGLAIAIMILFLLWGTMKSVGARLMDAIDPALLDAARHAVEHTAGVAEVRGMRLRWVGHRLHGDAVIEVDTPDLHRAEHIAGHAAAHVRGELRNLDDFTVTPTARTDPARNEPPDEDDGAMRIELLVVPDCPHQDSALQVVRVAGRLAGLGEVPVTVTVIDSVEEAQRRGFAGSPTFLIDGVDPFAQPGAPTGIACRIYPTPGGPAGVPTVEQLADALVHRDGAGSGGAC